MRSDLDMAVDLLQKPAGEGVQAALNLIQGTVFRFSMKLCRHREDAEDTMQEVLISSLRHLSKIETAQGLSAWLYTAARNRCWRNRSRTATRNSVSLDDPVGSDLDRRLAAAGMSPEQSALQEEDHHLIRKALLRLPPHYRIVLALHDLEDLNAGQIAQALSLEPGAVRVRLHRARLRLRKEVETMLHLTLDKQYRPAPLPAKSSTECEGIFSDLSKYLGGGIGDQSCAQIQTHLQNCPQCAEFIGELKLAMDRCRLLETSACASVGPSLQHLLTEEYWRLIAAGSSPAVPALAS